MPEVDGPTIPKVARRELLVAALDSLAIHLAIVDHDGRILAVNDAWSAFAAQNGAANHPTVGVGARYLPEPGRAEVGHEAYDGLRRVLSGELAEFRHEYPCHSPTELRWFEMRATELCIAGGGAVVVHTTITERKLAEQQLAFMAHHDELTGLANRRHLLHVLAGAQRSGRLGIVLADVDRFKAVNDTFGHAAGNDVLCAVADALGVPLPGGSLAGRHGGDEFAVALFDVDRVDLEAAVAAIAERVRQRLERMPFAAGTSLSIGATLIASDESVEDAIERADQALYAVKQSGRGSTHVA